LVRERHRALGNVTVDIAWMWAMRKTMAWLFRHTDGETSGGVRRAVRVYGVALLSSTVAFVCTAAFWTVVHVEPFFFFQAAVFLAAWFGGIGPGLFTILASTLLINYFFLQPYGSWPPQPSDILEGVLFLAVSCVYIVLSEKTRRASGLAERSRALLETLLASAPVGIAVYDNQLRCIRSNAALASMTGAPNANLALRAIADLVPGRAPELEMTCRRVIESGAPGTTLELETKKGSADRARYWLATVYPVRVAGERSIGVGVIVQDITERREAEERRLSEELLRRQTDALKRSNEELERFAYVASHDLQEPLRMVASYTQLLAKRYQGKLDADADEFIGYAVGGARRMQTLLQDLLTYSRVGTAAKPFEPTALGDVVERGIANLRLIVDESGAVITKGPLPTLMVDPTQMIQLFQNLLENSIKFRGKEPPKIDISAVEHPTEWIFAVKDNGIGIEPRHFERIFRVFQRLHGDEERPGTGIGLAVCKKIVERHGGHIWVESAPGKGSTFYFSIPIRQHADGTGQAQENP
jgi:PAS domain S-box-containing protein